MQIISIHAPHEGVRPICPCSFSAVEIFQSTHPTRGCDGQLLASFLHTRISIHAPHEGVRLRPSPCSVIVSAFQSTHPTRGCDKHHASTGLFPKLFQSTHPTRGCDAVGLRLSTGMLYFNPRTPRGGATHTCEYIKDFFAHFNPRTPRGGATINSSGKRRTYARFQSTHPARGCDFLKNFSDFHAQISIHAPREGVRRVPENVIILPLRISIHAPREGVRRGRHKCKRVIFHFNPRTPRGGATYRAVVFAGYASFQSTHPARGCDSKIA